MPEHLPQPENLLECLYTALQQDLGLLLESDDPERLRQKLYATRADADDAALDVLTFSTNAALPNKLLIIRRPDAETAPREKDT